MKQKQKSLPPAPVNITMGNSPRVKNSPEDWQKWRNTPPDWRNKPQNDIPSPPANPPNFSGRKLPVRYDDEEEDDDG